MRASLATTPVSSAAQVSVAAPAAANVCAVTSTTGSSELDERSASTWSPSVPALSRHVTPGVLVSSVACRLALATSA